MSNMYRVKYMSMSRQERAEECPYKVERYDLMEDGTVGDNIAIVRFLNEIDDWIEKNLSDPWTYTCANGNGIISITTYHFMNGDDAMLFKMRWGNAIS